MSAVFHVAFNPVVNAAAVSARLVGPCPVLASLIVDPAVCAFASLLTRRTARVLLQLNTLLQY